MPPNGLHSPIPNPFSRLTLVNISFDLYEDEVEFEWVYNMDLEVEKNKNIGNMTLRPFSNAFGKTVMYFDVRFGFYPHPPRTHSYALVETASPLRVYVLCEWPLRSAIIFNASGP